MESNIPKDNLNSLIKNTSNNNSINGTFIKVDDDRIINTNFIRWIKKKDECFYICSKLSGCYSDINNIKTDTHSVCKSTNSESYNKLLNLFN
jgi:hypothetical protein